MSKADDIAEALRIAEEYARVRSERRMDQYRPYPKQLEFHSMGARMRERLFIAGNQLGKTFGGANETAFHLTGEYPNWWSGRRFKKPVKCWVGNDTSELTRKGPQKYLMGEPGVVAELGTGSIPKAAILDISYARGLTDAMDMVQVRHKSGGVSSLGFKSYEQGRKKWQSETLDFIWFDEEPPWDIYDEGLTRTQATKGMVFITFTPLQGRSTVVKRFLEEQSVDRGTVTMTIYDAEHYTPEQRKQIIAGYPHHLREARSMGVPTQGEGRIFAVPEDTIMFDMPDGGLPGHWARGCGLDFGISEQHPFAAIWGAHDRDADTIYLYDEYMIKNSLPALHAVAIKARAMVPTFWPHDGLNRDKNVGEALHLAYKKHGVKMWDTNSTYENGSNSVEAGVMEMDERFQTGRLKVAKHLTNFWTQYRLYHREKGLIVKKEDDVLDAARGMIMMKRHWGRAGQYITVDGSRNRNKGKLAPGTGDYEGFGY